MKSLAQLIDTQRADLMHQLFPDDIPALLQFMDGMCKVFREDREQNSRSWDNSQYSFNYWLGLAKVVESKIDHFRRHLESSHYVFSEQLFTGELAAFSIHCLTVYTATTQHPNPKFTLAVDLLFNP